MIKILAPGVVALAMLPLAVHAQPAAPWSVGMVGLVSRSPYAAENTSRAGGTNFGASVFPYLAYRSETFFINGREAGIHVVSPSGRRDIQPFLDVIVAARSRGGTSRDKIRADAGLTVGIEGSFGSLSVTAVHDVTDTGNGAEIRGQYGYTFGGRSLSVTPSIGITRQSTQMADYVWGVSASEHTEMLAKDRPVIPVYRLTEPVLNYTANLVARYNVTDRWTLLGFGGVTWLDKDIRRHPGIDKKFIPNLAIAAAYNF